MPSMLKSVFTVFLDVMNVGLIRMTVLLKLPVQTPKAHLFALVLTDTREMAELVKKHLNLNNKPQQRSGHHNQAKDRGLQPLQELKEQSQPAHQARRASMSCSVPKYLPIHSPSATYCTTSSKCRGLPSCGVCYLFQD
ncbi:hypothetical protein ACROYT_G025866 [Oculina patagonica]